MPVFNAYIDGFNLYMGALKGRPELKWLDLVAFCEAARTDMQLGKIYFFTAAISEKYPGDDAPRRQEKYLRVLRSQGVEVVRGKFRKNRKWGRVASMERKSFIRPELPKHLGLTQLALRRSENSAKPGHPMIQYLQLQEKGSDVNLASYLLRDSYERAIDAALVVTGDSDFLTPVAFAGDFGVDVKVLVPRRDQGSNALRRVASSLDYVHRTDLIQSQLKKTFVTPTRRLITKPKEWS